MDLPNICRIYNISKIHFNETVSLNTQAKEIVEHHMGIFKKLADCFCFVVLVYQAPTKDNNFIVGTPYGQTQIARGLFLFSSFTKFNTNDNI